MSRLNTTKGKGAEKTKPPATQTPVITHEIIAGKYSENDWHQMIERDNSYEFVGDIMDELMEQTMSAVYSKYLERQLLPFTISQARDAIIEIIEWQFLARDEGEADICADLGWSQDSEPESCTTDCWAQGSVPRNFMAVASKPLEQVLEITNDVVSKIEEEYQETILAEAKFGDEASTPVLVYQESVSEIKDLTPTEKDSLKQVESTLSDKAPKRKFKPYKGKVKSAGVKNMSESLEETELRMLDDELRSSIQYSEDRHTLLNMPASCTSILKAQLGRPPGTKDVVYDDVGNVLAVMRIDPEKLPSHKIPVKYQVVDQATDASELRLESMKKGKSLLKFGKKKSAKSVHEMTGQDKQNAISELPPPLNRKNKSNNSRNISANNKNIEKMEVMPGVVITERGRTKRGPRIHYKKTDMLGENQLGLQPVRMRIPTQSVTVSDILDRHTPILRTNGDLNPLPPIIPYPPQSNAQQV